jgi:hypothetical protein
MGPCLNITKGDQNETGSTRQTFKINSPANTDNMGKLFVTLFAFIPALKTNL